MQSTTSEKVRANSPESRVKPKLVSTGAVLSRVQPPLLTCSALSFTTAITGVFETSLKDSAVRDRYVSVSLSARPTIDLRAFVSAVLSAITILKPLPLAAVLSVSVHESVEMLSSDGSGLQADLADLEGRRLHHADELQGQRRAAIHVQLKALQSSAGAGASYLDACTAPVGATATDATPTASRTAPAPRLTKVVARVTARLVRSFSRSRSCASIVDTRTVFSDASE